MTNARVTLMQPHEILTTFVLLRSVIDPIGTVPVFISSTQGKSREERSRIALIAASTAAGILLFFVVVGEFLLHAMGVPLLAFQIAGGIVLFLFALTMIFGEGKPANEMEAARSVQDTAIFPLATPSIASPGAMMAVVLLTENGSHLDFTPKHHRAVDVIGRLDHLCVDAWCGLDFTGDWPRGSGHCQPGDGLDTRVNRHIERA